MAICTNSVIKLVAGRMHQIIEVSDIPCFMRRRYIMIHFRNLLPWSHRAPDTYALPVSLANRADDFFDHFLTESCLMPGCGLFNRFPAMNISEDDSTINIKAELPDMEKQDIKVDFSKNRLTISGEKKSETKEDKSTYHRSELVYGKFARSIALPFEIDENKTKAEFNKGVLTITIQKPESEINKTKTIPVQSTDE